MMDGSGGTYNPSTNLATIDISGNAATVLEYKQRDCNELFNRHKFFNCKWILQNK
jgi:hypothetical protein